ncbi:uncharacterized protein LOC144334890 [Macaca mulatta]
MRPASARDPAPARPRLFVCLTPPRPARTGPALRAAFFVDPETDSPEPRSARILCQKTYPWTLRVMHFCSKTSVDSAGGIERMWSLFTPGLGLDLLCSLSVAPGPPCVTVASGLEMMLTNGLGRRDCS